jgi:hypothetical protein
MKDRCMFNLLSLVCVCAPTGCATFDMQLMSRSDGKVFEGTGQKVADGTMTMSATIRDELYTGLIIVAYQLAICLHSLTI